MRGTLLPLTLAIVAACKPAVAPDLNDRPEAALRRIADCDDLRANVELSVLESLVDGRYGYLRGGMMEDDVNVPTADGPTDYSTTNVQEAGVDELDLVKTDGLHLFIASDRGLQIVKSWPIDETELLATINFSGWLRGLFLVDDQLAVFEDYWDELDYRTLTRVHLVDVSNPDDPAITRTVSYEGWLTDARLVDGDVYAVLNQWIELPEDLWTAVWDEDLDLPEIAWDAPEEERTAAEAEARAILAPIVAEHIGDMPVSDLLPLWDDGLGAGDKVLLGCDQIYAPDNVSHLAMMSVIRLDPVDGSTGATGLLGDGWTIYASLANLYVAQTSWWWWGWQEEGVSHIHQFELHGDGAPSYEGSGEVKGWLYDQFAMSEHQGFLRVVSTDFRWFGLETEAAAPANHITVLHNEDGALAEVGHVGGIAPGEQIQAARLLGDKGYIVTFEQTDPLFTVDLSDPTSPEIVGELQMPGFSAYLHPIDGDHLLAVGMSGLQDGTLTGLAINLFDVSDFANPMLADQLSLSPPAGDGWSWSWSEAMWDHHAFTYHRETLTIPAYFEQWDAETGTYGGFSGAVSLHATAADGITELGRIDHRDLVEESVCLYDRWYDWGESACSWESGFWYAQVRRSVVIEDNLFTISDYGIKVTDLADPGVELARVVFYPQ
jgi:hypothetical protein